MAERDPRRPTDGRPPHGERRSLPTPTWGVVALVAVLAVAFVLLTWARYGT